MIFSKEQLLSDDQAITASAASTNHIDLGAVGTPHGAGAPIKRDIGKGQPIPFEVIVTEDFATLTSLTVALQVDDDVAFGSPKTIKTSGAIAAADLVAGANLFPDLSLPTGITERYVRLNYTVAGTNASAGKILAGVSMGRQTNV